MTGSVPDGRTRSRPRSPSWAGAPATALPPHRLRHRWVFERPAALETNAAQHLRDRLKPVADLARRLAELLHHRQHLHRRHQTVAGGQIVGQDDEARLLAPEVEA